MAGGSGEENPVGINVTALVDIIFCLCLFFMCSLKFKELDGKMDSWMPRDSGSVFPMDRPPEPRDEIRIVLSFDEATGEVQRIYGRRPIESGAAGDTLIRTLLREDAKHFLALGKKDVPVIIDAGARVPWRSVVDVMNSARSENIEKIEFGVGDVVRREKS